MINCGAVSTRDLDNGDLEITCNSMSSGTQSFLILDKKYREKYLQWWNGGASLDAALPHLSEEDQELILTGMTIEEIEEWEIDRGRE